MIDTVYTPVKPQAYVSSTPPVTNKANYSNTAKGVATGGMSGGWIGAAIGAASGLITDIWTQRSADRRAREANENARRNAAEANAASIAEARSAREWNSEQNQIRRMRMAGLSPGLAYGQMSPSTAQAADIKQAETHQADTPQMRSGDELLKAIQLLINQQNANTQAAAQQSTAGLQSSQELINRIDALTRNQSNLSDVMLRVAQSDLADAQKVEIFRLLAGKEKLQSATEENLNANTRAANANANVVEQTGVGLAQSEIALNAAKTATEKERPFEIRQNIETSGELATYYRRQSALLAQEFGVSQHKIDAVASWLDDNGYNRDYLGFALDFCNDMARNVGSDLSHQTFSTIFSWLSSDAWSKFLELNSEVIETHTDRDSYSHEWEYNSSNGSRSHTSTTSRKRRR